MGSRYPAWIRRMGSGCWTDNAEFLRRLGEGEIGRGGDPDGVGTIRKETRSLDESSHSAFRTLRQAQGPAVRPAQAKVGEPVEPPHSALRKGFTLTELIVSVAVLGLMMTLAGSVFHMTLKSTGEAKALTTTTQRMRELEIQMREDFRGVNPERSIMVIVPARMNAYWNAAGKDGDDDGKPYDKDGDPDGYPHPEDLEREVIPPGGGAHEIQEPRADRMCFVTARRGTSVVDPRISAGLQHVVYGHAILGDWVDTDPAPNLVDWKWRAQFGENNTANPPEYKNRFDKCRILPGQALPTDAFPVAAQSWHLARRSVLLPDFDPTNDWYDPAKTDYSPAVAVDLDDSPAARGKARWALVEGRKDVVASAGFNYLRDVVYLNPAAGAGAPSLATLSQWYARTELDLTPPSELASRLGGFFLPNCASFKVEFAIELPELGRLGEPLWVDPADLVTNVNNTGTAWNAPGLAEANWPETRKRFERMLEKGVNLWPGGINAPEYVRLRDLLHVKMEAMPDPSVDTRFAEVNGYPMSRWYTSPAEPPPGGGFGFTTGDADPLFPTALRVTIDVYDDEGRFERPIRQVMVFRVGG